MKCTVKEMIDYLSNFPPDDQFSLANYSGEAGIVFDGIKFEYAIWEWSDGLPEPPVSNKSPEYTSENYSD